MVVLSSGAEAVISRSKNTIEKIRPKKSYRIDEIDAPLRKFRTKREAKIIAKLQGLIPVPALSENALDLDSMTLSMSYVDGEKLRDALTSRNAGRMMSELGPHVAVMHDADIIHGDLTTSNIILEGRTRRLVLIDFGLSFFSQKIEDKAVDIHLFRRALESKHPAFFEKAFSAFCKSYEAASNNGSSVLKRLEQVEMRGRYKHKQ